MRVKRSFTYLKHIRVGEELCRMARPEVRLSAMDSYYCLFSLVANVGAWGIGL